MIADYRTFPRKIIGLVLALCVLPCTAQADDLASFVDTAARTSLRQTGAPSVTIGIMQRGTVVLARAYGSSRLSPDVAATRETTYDIGSITKQFVAAAILLLQQEHKLSVTELVSKYVPAAAAAQPVTISNLLNHTSGYVDYYPLDYVDQEMTRPTTADAIIKEYATLPLSFAPGSTYSYSNTDYTLLGKIIEVVSGMPFPDFLAARFFRPLGMTQTYCDSPSHVDPHHAYGYTSFFLGPIVRATPEAEGWIGAAGCLASTPADLLKWDAALTGGRVLDASSYAAMTAPTRLTGGKMSSYGYGIASGTLRGHRYIVHTGGLAGFSAFNIAVRDDDSALAIMYNRENVDEGPLARSILLRLYGKRQVSTPSSPTPSPQTKATPSPEDVAGAERVRNMILVLEGGKVDRTRFTPDYQAFLTPALARQASANLSKLGQPTSVEANVSQSQGQELTEATVRFASRSVAVTMRRTTDGKIAEFLVNPA